MRYLTRDECEDILDELGYYRGFGARRVDVLFITSGKVTGPKALFVWIGDRTPLVEFREFLLDRGIEAEALDEAIRLRAPLPPSGA